MTDYITRDEFLKQSRESTDEIVGVIQAFMQQVDERFTGLEGRLDRVESSVHDIKEQAIDLQESHNRLVNTIDGFLGRIDRYEIERAARDSQFERLLEWARKVSKKTGIPLENF